MTTSPSAVLAGAMDAAEAAGLRIPCKEAPESWTSDLLSFTSDRAKREAVALARACLDCPVFIECRAYADDAHRSRSTELYGVVAARLELATRHIEIHLRELTYT